MELQAIIGARKGKIPDSDSNKIYCYLYSGDESLKPEPIRFYTDADKLTDCLSEHNLFNQLNVISSRNVYFHVRGLTDPQAFFRYLSNHGYAIRDSKLTQEAHKKDSIIPMLDLNSNENIRAYTPFISPRGITEENPDKYKQGE